MEGPDASVLLGGGLKLGQEIGGKSEEGDECQNETGLTSPQCADDVGLSVSSSKDGDDVIGKVGRREGGGDLELPRPQRRLAPHVERACRETAPDEGDVDVVGDRWRVEKGR